MLANRLIIRCQQQPPRAKSSTSQPKNNKYEGFAKSIVDKRKIEINTINDSLKEISKNERARLKDLFNSHLSFFKNDGDLESQDVEETPIDQIVIKNNANDDFFEN